MQSDRAVTGKRREKVVKLIDKHGGKNGTPIPDYRYTSFVKVALPHRSRRPLVQHCCGDDTRRHVGAGHGRRPAISCRILANSGGGIATSGPILTSFSRRVVNDQCSISCGKANDCFGSKPVLRRDRQEGPFPEVKQTKSGAKRTLPLEGRLSGVELSYQRRGPNRRL